MKILSVTIRNLASYKGTYTLDFTREPLLGAGLYSIVGDTGAGKSTILDAICLALYGTAPRFKGGGDYNFITLGGGDAANSQEVKTLKNRNRNLIPSDPRNMLHWGSNLAEAIVVFQGKDSLIYQASWSTSFQRTNYGECYNTLSVQKEDGSFDTDHPVASVKNAYKNRSPKDANMKKIIDVLGLQYDEFTRSIMLAQNDFASFLKSNDSDKALTLEKITGTQIYTRVADRIVAHSNDAKRELDEFKTGIAEVEKNLLTDERLSELKAGREELKGAVEAAKGEKDKTEKSRKWKEERESILKDKAADEEEATALQARLTGSGPDRESLSIHDRLQPISPQWTMLLSARESVRSLKEERLPRCEEEVSGCEKGLAEAGEREKEAALLKTEREEERKEAGPVLHLARETLTLMASKRKDLSDAKTKLEAARRQDEKAAGELSQNRKAQEEKKETVRTSSVKEEGYADVRDLLGNVDLLSDRLRQFRSSLSSLESAQGEMSELREGLADLQSRKREAEGEEKTSREAFEKLSGEISQAETDMKAIGEQSELFALKEKLSGRKGRVANILGTIPLLSKALSDLATARLQMENLKGELGETSAALSAAKEQHSTLNALIPGKTATLSTIKSKDLGKARADLTEGEPCPLCGSVHHPYTLPTEGGMSEVDRIIGELEEELRRDKSRLRELDGTIATLDAKEKNLSGAISSTETDISHFEDRIREYREAVVRDCSLEDIPTSRDGVSLLDDGEGLSILRDGVVVLEAEIEREATQVQASLTTLQDLQKRHKKLSASRDKASAQLQRASEAKAKAEGDLAVQDQKIRSISDVVATCESDLRSKRDAVQQMDPSNLQVLFAPRSKGGSSPFDWEKVFLSKPDSFISRIKSSRKDYDAIVALKDKALSELLKLQGEEGALEGAAKTAEEAHLAAGKDYDSVAATLSALEEKSRGYFGGKDPDMVEKALDEAAKSAETHLSEARSRREKAATDLSVAKNKRDGILAQIASENDRASQLEGDISAFLLANAPDITRDRLPHYLSDTVPWNKLRSDLHKLDEDFAAARSRVEQDGVRLERHLESENATELSDEEIGERLRQQESRIDELANQCNEIEFLLIRHREALKSLSSRKEELDRLTSVWANWKDLRDIIGNVKGDELRRSVQSFTLSQLVNLANMHLGRMRSRYRLVQVPGTLSLKVIDTDFADAERSVSGLSGGETFIVSLSLALGLSTLSSRGQGFPMLFIDEGFGTLSKEYLNTVIDALSTLQESDNKKVCVISHTAEMRERVAVKVEVIKEGNGGCSRLVVTP